MMKAFKISHQNANHYIRWLLWFSLGLAGLYFALAIWTYLSGKPTWEWVINVAIGLIWLASGLFQVFGESFYFPDITLSDAGITYKIRKSEKLIRWSQIQDVKIDHNAIIVRMETDDQEELRISHLEYKELQTVKDRLRQFSETHNVNYSSKY